MASYKYIFCYYNIQVKLLQTKELIDLITFANFLLFDGYGTENLGVAIYLIFKLHNSISIQFPFNKL